MNSSSVVSGNQFEPPAKMVEVVMFAIGELTFLSYLLLQNLDE
jgi:hypothetical protein